MTYRLHHQVVNAPPVQTTTSAQVVVASWTPGAHSPVVNNCIVHVRAFLFGKSTGNEGAVHNISASFKVLSGTVTQLGVQALHMSPMHDAAIATSCFLSTASNAINLRVDGVSGKTIDWTGWLEIYTSEF